jgi:predicted Zn-dependent peptidase
MVKKSRITLANGLPFVAVEVPGSKSIVVSFWTKAGSRLDPPGKDGTAHFLEHALLGKSRSYPTDEALGNYLEGYGIWKNGFTNKEYVNFTMDGPEKHADKIFPILSELMFDPLLDEKSVDQEREIIKKEIARKKSQQDIFIWDVWIRTFMSGTPMENPVLGTNQSLDTIKTNDLKNFWSNHFKSKNSMLFVSGGSEISKTKSLADKHFGETKLSNNFNLPLFQYQDSNKVAVEKIDLPQTMVQLSFRTESDLGDDYYSLQVLRYIFALGWGSRMIQRLRVKEKLIYSRFSSIQRYLDTGAWILNTSTEKGKLPKLLSVLSEELRKIKNERVSASEIERAVNFMEGGLLTNTETSQDYYEWYGVNELHWPERSESVEKRIEKVKKVTVDDVLRVANKYIRNDNWNIGAIGDVDEKDLKIEI